MSLRLKLLASFVALASLCAVVVASTLISFFTEDKTTYVRDLEVDIATSTAVSLDLLLHTYRERLLRIAEGLSLEDDPAGAAQAFLSRNRDCVYLGVYNGSQHRILTYEDGVAVWQGEEIGPEDAIPEI